MTQETVEMSTIRTLAYTPPQTSIGQIRTAQPSFGRLTLTPASTGAPTARDGHFGPTCHATGPTAAARRGYEIPLRNRNCE